MIEFLNEIDTQLFLWLNGPNTPFLDSFMKIFTGRFVWVPMYAALLVMLWRTVRWPKMIFYVIGVALAVTVTDQVCAHLIRPAVERLRPSNLQNALSSMAYIVDGYRGGRYGFPSCHAANSFSMAVFMALLVRRHSFSAFIIGWAVLNSYTRLYLGVHYPGDLFVGMLIGVIVGAGCYWLVRRLFDRHTTQAQLTWRATAPMATYAVAAFPTRLLPGVNAVTAGATVGVSAAAMVAVTGIVTIAGIAVAAMF